MQLARSMGSYTDVLDCAGSSIEIGGITPDSDRVLPGYLFVALLGAGEDGHSRVHQTLLKGAVAVLGEWPPDDLPENLPWGVFAFVHVLDVAKAWFWLCNNWGHLCKLGADSAHDHTNGPNVELSDTVPS